jgi:hypothetical protein
MDEDWLRRHDLTDEEWSRLEPVLAAHPRQGHRWNDHRLVIDGIFFRARDRVRVAGPARVLRELEDRAWPASPLVRGRDLGDDPVSVARWIR